MASKEHQHQHQHHHQHQHQHQQHHAEQSGTDLNQHHGKAQAQTHTHGQVHDDGHSHTHTHGHGNESQHQSNSSSTLFTATPGGESFRTTLKTGCRIVFDGAMGSELYAHGYLHTKSFEEANLTAEEKVLEVHKSYIKAGAHVIETNTFGANRFVLARHGLENKISEINEAGVKLAQKAVQEVRPTQLVWIAGSVGPTGQGRGYLDEILSEKIEDAYREQISALAKAGADILVLETFQYLAEIRIALSVAKSIFGGPIVAQMSFDDEESASNMLPPAKIALLLKKWGAEVIGVNCGAGWGRVGEGGPAAVYDVAEEMIKALNGETPVIACPNAGHPKRVDNRNIYLATPEYFSVYAKRLFKSGVQIVGGCCGTNSEHIASVLTAAKMFGSVQVPDQSHAQTETSIKAPAVRKPEVIEKPVVPLAERSKLAAKVARVWQERLDGGKRRQAPKGPEDFVVSVEVNPVPGLSTEKPVNAAKMLLAAGVDVLNIADGPRATVRMNNATLGHVFQNQLETEVILHVCCRDRNLLGLLSDLLGLYVQGSHNLVVITGDPPKMGDYPKATAVYDLDSIGLLKVIDGLNKGVDPAGRQMDDQTHFFLATGAEPGAVDYQRELTRLQQKIANGAEMVMTQPVYDPKVMERFLNDVAKFPKPVPVLMGLCPLVSFRNAEFLNSEVPGMSVPPEIMARMEKAGKGPAAQAEGVAIAREMLAQFADQVVGCYIMPQLHKYSSAVEVLKDLGYGAKS